MSVSTYGFTVIPPGQRGEIFDPRGLEISFPQIRAWAIGVIFPTVDDDDGSVTIGMIGGMVGTATAGLTLFGAFDAPPDAMTFATGEAYISALDAWLARNATVPVDQLTFTYSDTENIASVVVVDFEGTSRPEARAVVESWTWQTVLDLNPTYDATGGDGPGGEAIEGTPGNDLLPGSEDDDLIFGFGGNDWITPGAGSDTVEGGDGVDMVSFVDAVQRVVVNLAAGTAISGDDTNILRDIENVTGSIYGDLITGDEGNNRLRGLGDYDWFVGSGGQDTIDGGTGRDTVAYSSATSGVWASLVSRSGNVGQANGDTYISIENLTGSSHADRLTGDNDRNVLRGLGGDDFIFGNGGNDTIDGGAGRDFLSGGDGNDRITGGRGNDTIDGGRGWDTALYSGNRADYDVVTNANGSTSVFHSRGTREDGIDLLVNVEVLDFADGRVFIA
jgi:Ca2+-binding RTX toxin-like protein